MRLDEVVGVFATKGETRVTPRFVRFLIANKLMASPGGSRTRPEYGDGHVAQIRRYLALRDRGLSVADIGKLAATEANETVELRVAPGVALLIVPHLLDRASPPSPDAVAALVSEVLATLFAETQPADEKHGDQDHAA